MQTVIALGFFDGVHIGHGALLKKTAERAAALQLTPAAFTFDRPPKEAVFGTPIPLINSSDERAQLMRGLYGMEKVIVAPFDRAMMTMPWDTFISELLVGQYRAVHLVAGHDFRFGHRNLGTPALLEEKCRSLGIGCDIIPAVTLDGRIVSSTYIRTLLEEGDVENAARYLGHPHLLGGFVTHGQRLGRRLGIPTINFAAPEKIVLPRDGVYVTSVTLPNGSACTGVTNIGCRPTVGGENRTVETYLLDFDGELYGEHIQLRFLRRLRDECKFDSLDGLKAQIAKDIDAARRFF